MKRTSRIITPALTALPLGLLIAATGCSTVSNSELARYQEAERIGMARITTFDTLDFDVFSNQKWDRLHESHADDIVVTWPDGHETKGIEKHIEDLKALFVFAPDITIKVHPIRFGSGTWTTATGVMTGSFTQPMPTPDGKTIAPTGKRFAIGMATIGHWKSGKMDHEWLFWDNQDFMNQIGLGK